MNSKVHKVCGRIHDNLCYFSREPTKSRKRRVVESIGELLKLNRQLGGRLQEIVEETLKKFYVTLNGETFGEFCKEQIEWHLKLIKLAFASYSSVIQLKRETARYLESLANETKRTNSTRLANDYVRLNAKYEALKKRITEGGMVA